MQQEPTTTDPYRYASLLEPAELSQVEAAALMVNAREWMNRAADVAAEWLIYDGKFDRTHTNAGFKAGDLTDEDARWDLFVEFRSLYMAARMIFIRRFFEVPPTS